MDNKDNSLNSKLISIQSELNAPKGQTNTFGKYQYRSCEDILGAVKPLLKKYDCLLTLSDEIVLIGTRYYVKATATLSGEMYEKVVSAYAREEEIKKGMDSSQITGSASSYARKYALNGLFAIDDTKDADTQDNTEVKEVKPVVKEFDRQKALDYINKWVSNENGVKKLVVLGLTTDFEEISHFTDEQINAYIGVIRNAK